MGEERVSVEVSSPDKLMFPEVGLTKADLVAHYERVAQAMLPFVADRPLTLQRFPRGVDAKGFMQKNAAKHYPSSIRRHAVDKRDGERTHYPVVDRALDLAWLANQNTVTFHMWTSTTSRPEHPDWFVLDLDPERHDVEGVRHAVRVVRELLDEFGLVGFVLATGSKGFHVWVRLDGERDFGEVSVATRALAGLAASRAPERLTTEFLKKNRAERVFVDWLRNTPIATVVAPFSVRARARAPVAVPVRWSEFDDARPDDWTITSLEDRLDVDTDTPACALAVDDIVEAARRAGVDLDTPHDRFGR